MSDILDWRPHQRPEEIHLRELPFEEITGVHLEDSAELRSALIADVELRGVNVLTKNRENIAELAETNLHFSSNLPAYKSSESVVWILIVALGVLNAMFFWLLWFKASKG